MRTTVEFGVAGAIGAVAGTALNRLISGWALLLAFALLLLAAAAALLLRREEPVEKRGNSSLARVGLSGVLTRFGVGGGFLIVPAPLLLLGLPLTFAVGTSLGDRVESAAAIAAHLASGSMHWAVALTFNAAAIAGPLAGRRVGAHVAPRRLGHLFALLLLAVAVFLVPENAFALV